MIDAFNGNAYYGNNSSTNGIAVNPTGNVGIGTTTPLQKLDVNGSIGMGGPGNGLYLRDATNDPNKNTVVAPLLLHEGLTSGNGSTLGWGLHLSAIPWTWGEDPIYYHAGIHSFLTVVGNGSESEAMRINADGNVGIGTGGPGAKLEVNGNIKLTNGSGASITFEDGTVQSTAWTGTLVGGDYAESVSVSGDRAHYEPGDVLVVSADDTADVTKSSEGYSTLVVGVYSTKPGMIGRRQSGAKNEKEIPMAMIGIVPIKVSAENGPIKKGDPLVTASIPGYAMKGTERDRMFNAVLGKALGPLDSGTGVIEAVVSLQ